VLMRLLSPLRKSTTVRIFVLFCVLSFATDVLDLRDELLNIDNFNSALEDNITTGIHSNFFFNPPLALIPCVGSSFDQLLSPIWCFSWETASSITTCLYHVNHSSRAPPVSS
jgi:hypothetical protein